MALVDLQQAESPERVLESFLDDLGEETDGTGEEDGNGDARLMQNNLGISYQRCADQAQARNADRREYTLSQLMLPDGRTPMFSKAARKKIPDEHQPSTSWEGVPNTTTAREVQDPSDQHSYPSEPRESSKSSESDSASDHEADNTPGPPPL
eukprot:gene32013-16534_t